MKGAVDCSPSRLDYDPPAPGNWLPNFEKALAGFSDAAVRRKGAITGDRSAMTRAVTDYLLAVHHRTPDYLRLPFRLLVLLFDASPVLLRGWTFHRLDADQRIAWIEKWEGSRLEVCRRLMEMYGSLAMFGIYSEIHGKDYEQGPAASGGASR